MLGGGRGDRGEKEVYENSSTLPNPMHCTEVQN